jgi:hypothetical protein
MTSDFISVRDLAQVEHQKGDVLVINSCRGRPEGFFDNSQNVERPEEITTDLCLFYTGRQKSVVIRWVLLLPYLVAGHNYNSQSQKNILFV